MHMICVCDVASLLFFANPTSNLEILCFTDKLRKYWQGIGMPLSKGSVSAEWNVLHVSHICLTLSHISYVISYVYVITNVLPLSHMSICRCFCMLYLCVSIRMCSVTGQY
jgi:hypothetical protein